MPDNATILNLAPGAAYLAANAKNKTPLYGGFGLLNPLLPNQIYALYFVINKIYSKDPNYSGMTAACLYLWEIMGRYGLAAQGLSGGGGSVPSPTPIVTPLYPFFVNSVAGVSSDFESDGVTYINTNMRAGDVISLFANQFSQQWLLEGADTFTRTSNGFIMNIPGFDANTQDWTIMVQQIFNSGGGATYPYIFDLTFSNTFN